MTKPIKPTISKLAKLIGSRCGKTDSEIAKYIWRAREAGLIPDGGPGGPGSVHAPDATAEHAVVLLLAMMQASKGPKQAVEDVGYWRASRPLLPFYEDEVFERGEQIFNKLQPHDAEMSEEERTLIEGTSFGGILVEAINLSRRKARGLIPKEIRIGGRGATKEASLVIWWRRPDGKCFQRDMLYVPAGVFESFKGDGGINAPLQSLNSIGGRILVDIAELLGSIAASGDDGSDVKPAAVAETGAL